mgnify:FL=1
MKRIASFEVNHDKLKPGMYTSRIDGDITTYDIRMVYPNAGTYIQPAAGHTFEHLFATYARNSKFADQIIYCGPMGCQTGFYFLVRDMKPSDAIALVQESMAFIALTRARFRARAALSAAIICCTIWQAQSSLLRP